MSRPEHPHRQAYAYCAYCPKMCRFSCPVSEATQSETLSAWGKMTEAHLLTQNQRTVDEDGAKALYACTGCMRCRSHCKHDNEVGYALFDARRLALDAGKAPPGAQRTRETFLEHGNPFGPKLMDAVTRFKVDAPVRFPLFPGCSSLTKAPGRVEDAIAVGEQLSAPLGVSRLSNRCCGYPLYAAGDSEAFSAHARKTAAALAALPEMVVLDPGCAYTFRVVYPRFGVELKTRVYTVYEVLAQRLDHAPAQPPLPLKVRYHDACHLGRGLGQYEEPRKLLSAAVEAVVPGMEEGDDGGCSGGGGLLPRTQPQVALEVARREAAKLTSGVQTVVTACTTSQRMFERAGTPAQHLLSVLRQWLEQGRGSTG